MNELIKDIGEWSNKTFGEHDRTEEIFSHLKDEADEAIAYYKSDRDVMYWAYADCFILLFDGMFRNKLNWNTMSDIIKAKMLVNKRKNWSNTIEKESINNNHRKG